MAAMPLKFMPLKLMVAVSQLQAGGVIAYPTEGVWGIGCDPHNWQAVRKLLALKGRSPDKGLILVAAAIEQFAPLLQGLTPKQYQQLQQSWPGPHTWLVPIPGDQGVNNDIVPRWITGRHDRVALRVSDHPIVVELCRRFGGPVVSTSANRAGRPVATYPWQIRRQLPELDFVLQGALGGAGKPSQIRDLVSGEIVRRA